VVFRLIPREEKFFSYFEQLSETICQAADMLQDFSKTPVNPEQNLEMLNELEERGDSILSMVMNQINSSFITPFDREDILLLARALNNVLDHIQGTMEKYVLYKAGPPKGVKYILKLIDVLGEAAIDIRNAVALLSDVRTRHNEIIDLCEKIRSSEHEGDYLYRSGIALLFDNTENIIDIIKWKEIYEHLETTLDHCETVSNVIKGIAVKYV